MAFILTNIKAEKMDMLGKQRCVQISHSSINNNVLIVGVFL